MSSQIGRNDPCPCGSGKKYKNCCYSKGILHNKKKQNKAAIVVLAGVVFLAVAVSISKITSSSSVQSQPPFTTNSALPAQSGSTTGGPYTPQPPGPAPAGKVWSPEHGHWHDAPATNVLPGTASTPPNSSLPSSSSPVFDILPQQVQTQSQAQGNFTPQPPGPAPAGKVWSPEHGHWHDASVAGPTGTTAQPGQTNQLTPQPPGPAPAGKVWSPEHGHWHDAPAEPKVIQVTPSTTDPK